MTFSYLFGSRVRGDQGKFSDKDALVISTKWSKASEEINFLKERNCDVSFFDLQKSNHLLNSGSLFFKHIVDEGKLLIGDKKASEKFLKKWVPKKIYSEEIEHNIDLLETLNYLPQNRHSNLIGNDILIISIRNILIRKLAEKGIYKFAWSEIFAKAIEHSLIDEEDKNLLLLSKTYKNIYRQGQRFIIRNSFVYQLKNILEKIITEKITIDYTTGETIKKRANLLSSFSYKHLRYLEILTSLYPIKDNSDELNTLRKLSENPNYVSNSNVIGSSQNLAY